MARTGKYELVIRPKGRSPADEYSHKGKIWIEGRENSNYVIEITNHSRSRVMAVVSVDGISVVDGQPASFDSRGYVLEPRATVSIPGWLVNNQTAAQFTFSKMAESYASQSGQDGNQGVIGVAWFGEQEQYRMVHDVMMLSARTPMNSSGNLYKSAINPHAEMAGGSSMAASSVAPSMGTGFGEQQKFATHTTKFEKASSQPNQVSLIYYDSANNLVKRGIKLAERRTKSDPQAFPANPGYCAPPPGWATKKWSS